MDNAVVILLVVLYITVGMLLFLVLFLETRKWKRSLSVALSWPFIVVIGGATYMVVSILAVIASPFMCTSHNDSDFDHTV